MDPGADTWRKLNTLAKWRVLFAGWQLGTRPSADAECAAVRDHREVTILLRAEASALAGLLIRKGVITAQEWDAALGEEAVLLNADYERRFPGVTASETGLRLDPQRITDNGWMRHWRP